MAKYEVTREPAGDGTLWVVRNGAGKVLTLPMALNAARDTAYDYELADQLEEAQERACAELDGP